MPRPKSSIPKMKTSSRGRMRANSVIDCDRWLRKKAGTRTAFISATLDDHVRVGRDGDVPTDLVLHEACRKAVVDEQDHVEVLELVGVVGRRGGQVEAGVVVVADVQVGRVVDTDGWIGVAE